MIKKDLETCCEGDFSYYSCEFSQHCGFGIKPENCAYDFQKKVAKTDLLRDDCIKQGYTIYGVEAHAVYLSEDTDLDVTGEDLSVGSWARLRSGHKIRPYIVEDQEVSSYQLRPSELGSRCLLSGIVNKAKQEYKLGFPLDNTAHIGTAAHKICNDQPIVDYAHNHTWERLGIGPIVRSDYCEKTVTYSYNGIRMKGKPDALFMIGDDLIIFDFKRALAYAYESPKIMLQLLAYGCALGANPKEMFLITSKRPFPAEMKGFKRSPKHMITKPSQRMLDLLHEEIEKRFYFQRRCLDDPDYFIKGFNDRKSKQKGGCIMEGSTCFNFEICRDLVARVKDGEELRSYLAEGILI